ncbi:MAG TPA: PTS sugar transporter subunit IIA, partial [Gemmatimonadales bacterium]|nr:PTS sugar transporter subunit IIA [Gemmatimonadales bacterium]
MNLKDFFSPDAIDLALRGSTKDEILAEMVGLLRVDERSSGALLRILQRRENLGSTGVGRGIAIPHGRSLVVSRL